MPGLGWLWASRVIGSCLAPSFSPVVHYRDSRGIWVCREMTMMRIMMMVLLITTMACSTFPVLVLFYSVHVFILHPATSTTTYSTESTEDISISPSPTPTYPLGRWRGSRPKLHFCSQLVPTGKSTATEKRWINSCRVMRNVVLGLRVIAATESIPSEFVPRNPRARGSALRIHFDRIRQVDSVFRIDVDILYIFIYTYICSISILFAMLCICLLLHIKGCIQSQRSIMTSYPPIAKCMYTTSTSP